VGNLKATKSPDDVFIFVLNAVEWFLLFRGSGYRGRSRSVSATTGHRKRCGVEYRRRGRTISGKSRAESAASFTSNLAKSSRRSVPSMWLRQIVSRAFRDAGVEPRLLTVFFSDLENFPATPRGLAPADLADNRYPPISRRCPARYPRRRARSTSSLATVVHGFWHCGQRRPRSACLRGALRAARRMEARQRYLGEARSGRESTSGCGLNCAKRSVGKSAPHG